MRFRHPLVRSAAYRSASELDRHSVHRALADVTDAALEPDRRAWHRAQATRGPDDDVASELERSAGRAQARGGLAAAAAFLGRAADLTADPARRTDRMLAAAQVNLQAGAFDEALGLLGAAEAGPLDELGLARLNLLQAEVASAQNRGRDAPLMLLDAARKFETLDVRLSRDTYLDAWGAALFAGEMASEGGSLHDVSSATATAPEPESSPRPSDQLLDGLALIFTKGRATAKPTLQRAVKAFAGAKASAEEMLRWGWMATAAAVWLWDYDSCLAIATSEVQLARELGALEVLVVGVNVMGQATSLGGDFGRSALLMAEADAVTEATRTQVAPYAGLVLAGFRGQEGEASALIDGTIKEASAGGQGTAVQYAHWANAVLMNGLGRYEAGTRRGQGGERRHSGALRRLVVPERAGRGREQDRRRGVAADALVRLSEQTRGCDSDWGLGIEARSRALLADGDAAERLYAEAIDRLERTELRPDLARARLLYGEWLRRENGRRSDAREQLRSRARRTSSPWAPTPSPSAPVMSSRPPARRCEPAETTRATSSLLRRSR